MAHTKSPKGFPDFWPKLPHPDSAQARAGRKIIEASKAEGIREYSRGQKGQWQKFSGYVERRARASSREKILRAKKVYLVLLFEGAELDLLLDLDSGEIHEIVDGRFKWFLMNHYREHLDVKPFLNPANDSRVCAFASYTCGLSPKYVRELFDKNADTVFIEKDEDGKIRHYHYDLSRRRDNPDIVIGVAVICKDTKPKKTKQR